jgi:hypothetical protein
MLGSPIWLVLSALLVPLPDTGFSLPAPDTGFSLPAPDTGFSLPAPDTVLIEGAAWILPGSSADDRLRLQHLATGVSPGGYLIRSLSHPEPRKSAWPGPWGTRVTPVPPWLETSWNSAIPHSINNSGLWAGRGLNARIIGGVNVDAGPLSVVLAPELTYVANREFEFAWSRDPARSSMLPPWRTGETSADLPVRHGTEPVYALYPGESSITFSAGSIALGAATESQWWGPGIRNALVMSNNAPGIPHAFVRTGRPLTTWLGDVEAKLLAGTLTESLYFDSDPSNDYRFLSAMALTVRPTWEPQLTLGVARAVYGHLEEPFQVTGHALDALVRWNQQRAATTDTSTHAASEQILSLFWRWILPAEHLEFYGEWARTELPINLRDLLLAPHHSQGYTVGFQWLSPPRARGQLRVQVELTSLESSSKIGGRPARGFYTSPRVSQGYTQRGQVIGAAIGPGSSSQWLAADYVHRRGRIGLFGNRIRWDEDGFYTQPVSDRHLAHDVSFVAGFRGGIRVGRSEIMAELARDHRLNYLFQNDAYWFDTEQGVDITNYSLRFSILPWTPRQ